MVCVDIDGFANGNDGFQEEKYQDKTDADVIWIYDMIKELKVFPHMMSACSPVTLGDLIFIVTANGVGDNHIEIPSPEAPSFICLNKTTGKLVWQSNLPGKNIMHGQWANPACANIKGKEMAIFPGGDGWLYSFEAKTGKLIWKFDANPKSSKYELGGRGTRSEFISSPVIYGDRVYIGTGQDPEHHVGIGNFWCIDPSREGDISPELVTDATKTPPATKSNPNSGVIWIYGGNEKRPFSKVDFVFGRTMSTACIVDDVVYIPEISGEVHCLDAETGKRYWVYDTKAAFWNSCFYADGKVFCANEDGDMYIFKHDKKPQVLDWVEEGSNAAIEAEKQAREARADDATIKRLAREAYDKAALKILGQIRDRYLLQKVEIGEAFRSTPIMANGILYLMSERTLFAINPK